MKAEMIDDKVRAAVLDLRAGGSSIRAIATQLAVSKSVVGNIIKSGQPAAANAGPATAANAGPPVLNNIEANVETAHMDDAMANEFLSGLNDRADPGPKGGGKIDDEFLNSFMADIDLEGGPKKLTAAAAKKALKKHGHAAPEPKAAVAPPPPKEALVKHVPKPSEDKGSLIAKITLNANAFEDQLKDFLKPTKEEFIGGLLKKTQNELAALLSTMEYSRSINNTANILKHITYTGAAVLEMGTKKYLKMNTSGYADTIKATTELEALLREIAMENQGIVSTYQSPTMRLSALLIMTLMSVDSKNRAGAPVVATDKYNDL
jgi:hypothetical protein